MSAPLNPQNHEARQFSLWQEVSEKLRLTGKASNTQQNAVKLLNVQRQNVGETGEIEQDRERLEQL